MGGGNLEVAAKLLGADDLYAGVHEGVEDSDVLGQAVDDNVGNPGVFGWGVVGLGDQ